VDDLKDILLDGEEVLWSDKPDWSKAEGPKKGWRAKSGVIKFAATMLLAFFAMMAFGMVFDPEGFASGILGVLILLSAISFVVALLNFFDKNDSMQIRYDHIYAITNRRIIVHERSRLTTQSVMGPVLFEVATIQNGSVKNLSFSYAHPDEGFATMYALSDASAPEKLMIERFSRRKAEK